MTLTPVMETHIYLDDRGVPWVKRAGVSVKQVVQSLQQAEFNPQDVVRHYPYLTLSEVHAALVYYYYYDHRSDIDAALAADQDYVAKAQAEYVEPPLTKRLREAGKLP